MWDPRAAFDGVRHCNLYTAIDLKSSFHQVLTFEVARRYLAFKTPIGTWEHGGKESLWAFQAPPPIAGMPG